MPLSLKEERAGNIFGAYKAHGDFKDRSDCQGLLMGDGGTSSSTASAN